MVTQILHLSQWFHKHGMKRMRRLFDKLLQALCAADIPGCANIHPSVSFSHGALGVVINPKATVGEKCIIGPKVTLGNAFPRDGGAPTLGKHVYVGNGAFVGGGIFVSDYVIIGANAVLTKDVLEPGVIVAGVPAKIIRKLTTKELEMLNW